jgi:hypothetical protein
MSFSSISESLGGGVITFKTGGTNTLKLENNGDISFYEDTGTTAKLFWDASAERLGIGTASPAAKLEIDGGTGSSTAGGTLVVRQKGDTSADGIALTSSDSVSHRIWKDASGNLNIGSSSFPSSFVQDFNGNVGIGTSSPRSDANTKNLSIESSGSTARLLLNSTSTNGKEWGLYSSASGNLGFYNYSDSSEVMRIDSSGRVIVNNAGSGNGIIKINGATGNTEAVIFERGGTEASRIGHANDADLTFSIGSGASEAMRILSTGGITFNGDTAQANALDDYEEGTWTPVIADATSGGNTGTASSSFADYTKIGDLVHVQLYLQGINTSGMTSGNDLYIRNLPFTTNGFAIHTGTPSVSQVTFSGNLAVEAAAGQSYIRISESVSASNRDFITVGNLNSGVSDIFLTLTYKA